MRTPKPRLKEALDNAKEMKESHIRYESHRRLKNHKDIMGKVKQMELHDPEYRKLTGVESKFIKRKSPNK